MYDRDGNAVKLSDLRGKMVYVDVWATWCGPCVGEIPFMEELYERYKDDDRIVLVSISVDDKADAWKKKLDEDNPGWPQYIVDGGLKSQLIADYQILGVPRFMLFDAQGNIVTLNAPRPSNEDIIKFLDEQLSKPPVIRMQGGMRMIKMG